MLRQLDMRRRWIRLISIPIATVLGTFLLIQRPALAEQKGDFVIELNKIAQEDTACRLYFMVENETSASFRNLSLELVFLNRDKVFTYNSIFDFGGLPAGRTRLVSFLMKRQKCGDIGQVLVNNVEKCDVQGKASVDCNTALKLKNRTKLEFKR